MKASNKYIKTGLQNFKKWYLKGFIFYIPLISSYIIDTLDRRIWFN